MNARRSIIDGRTTSAVLVDAHVHIHDCFDLASFFTAAAKNFATTATRLRLGNGYVAFLCLTETSSARKFHELRAIAEKKPGASITAQNDWRINANYEPESVCVTHPEHGSMHIVAGKQIVVAERLEVLALGCASAWRDGLPISRVLDELISEETIAVLPWGFGKWLGRRGKVLRSILEKYRSPFLFLGDNSGRPVFFFEPKEFAMGRDINLRVLPGTDPLPFSTESGRAGSFGFHTEFEVDDRAPWESLRGQLIRHELGIMPFGKLESPLRFITNQVAMQYTLRKKRRAA